MKTVIQTIDSLYAKVANQLTGFYMMATLEFNELKVIDTCI